MKKAVLAVVLFAGGIGRSGARRTSSRYGAAVALIAHPDEFALVSHEGRRRRPNMRSAIPGG